VYGLHRIEDVTLRAAERGEAEKCKLGLQLTDVVTAKCKIVRQISGTPAMRFMKGQWPFEQRRFQFDHVRTKQGELRRELFKQMLVQDSHGE
jgi:hypothetical protein